MSGFPRSADDFQYTCFGRDADEEDVFHEVVDAELSTPEVPFLKFDREQLRFGAFAKNFDDLPEGAEKYYLTTAIAYTNGLPHVGHAYEFLTSDVLVRLHRFLGYDTYFLTGADEHGQKVAESASRAGLDPLAHCNIYVSAFQRLNDKLRVSNDRYIRTTDSGHQVTCQRLWQRCADAGDIYLGKYEGWYNEREELFVTQQEAEKSNFMDEVKNVPLKRVSEESYFFRMSKYADRLVAHIKENPSFIEPESARINILSRLEQDELKDLSISRTTFSWGIPLASDFDQSGTTGTHVMYVWFDALSNYLSGVHYLDEEAPAEGAAETGEGQKLRGYWPASKHVIGKDITWFHCVIWPTILMSAGLPLFKGVFSHGFVNGPDGRKMSKSLGNNVDPGEVLEKFEIDAIRYFVCSAATYGSDLNFVTENLETMRNSELADILGNLVQRGLNLCHLYCGGKIPDVQHDADRPLPFDLGKLIDETKRLAGECAINNILFNAMEAARATNRFLTEAEPWKMKAEDESRRPAIVRTTLEAIYAFTHFLGPVIPIAAEKIFKRLRTRPRRIDQLSRDFYNLQPGRQVDMGAVLFPRREEDPGVVAAAKEAASAKAASAAAAKSKAKAAAPEDPNQAAFTKLDMRVGRIVKVWHHETAEKLFCEEVDIGTGVNRPVVSGLRLHYSLEEMLGRNVVFVANLPEANMKGFDSTGMVLAATNADGSKVELVTPPEGAAIGERIFLQIDAAGGEGIVPGEPWAVSRVKNKKVWSAVAKDLRTDANCVACWEGKALMTSAGACTVPSNSEAVVS